MQNISLKQNERPNWELPKLLYTIKETARILSMSEKSVRRLIKRGLLKCSHALRTILITSESIEAFVKMTT
jgi:DNA-binding CsgD family transcriptional regulator